MSEYDPTNEQQQGEAHEESAKVARLRRLEEIGDIRWLMSEERGRRLVWRLLAMTGVYRSSFNSSGSVMAFNEGQRNIGLKLVADIHEACPEQYTRMRKEAISASQRNTQRSR